MSPVIILATLSLGDINCNLVAFPIFGIRVWRVALIISTFVYCGIFVIAIKPLTVNVILYQLCFVSQVNMIL